MAMQQALLSAGLPPPGIVPGQYCGRVKSYNPKQGYGFLECLEARQHYGRDVFIHKAQMGDLLGRFVGPGTKLEPMALKMHVRFCVEVNKQGMPQARDVIRVEDLAEGATPEGPPPAMADGAKHGHAGVTTPPPHPAAAAEVAPCASTTPIASAPEAPPPVVSVPPAPPPPPDLPAETEMVDAESAWGEDNSGSMRGYKGRGGTIRILPGAELAEAADMSSPQGSMATQVVAPPAPQRGTRGGRSWMPAAAPSRGSPGGASEGPPKVPWEHAEDEAPRRMQPHPSAMSPSAGQEGRWHNYSDPYVRQQGLPPQPLQYQAFPAGPHYPSPGTPMSPMGHDGVGHGGPPGPPQQPPTVPTYAMHQFAPNGMQVYLQESPMGASSAGSYGAPFAQAMALQAPPYGAPPVAQQPGALMPQQYGTFVAPPQFQAPQGYVAVDPNAQQYPPHMMPYPQQYAMSYAQPPQLHAMQHPAPQPPQQQPPPQPLAQQLPPSPQAQPYAVSTPPSPGYGPATPPRDCGQQMPMGCAMVGAPDYACAPSAIPEDLTPGINSDDEDGVCYPVFRGMSPGGFAHGWPPAGFLGHHVAAVSQPPMIAPGAWSDSFA